MICRQCQRRASSLAGRLQLQRTFSTAIPRRNAAGAAAAESATAAENTYATLPGSTTNVPDNTAKKSSKLKEPIVSSCPAGTVLTGLNYFKGKTDPVALADEEYPDWLWRCLEVIRTAKDDDTGAGVVGDEFSKSKKQRRLVAKKQRKLEAKLLASGNLEALAPKIPLQHQSINLPGQEGEGLEGAVYAAEKRDELRRAMRKERRAKIKESNYLKSM